MGPDTWCSVTHLNCPGFTGTLAALPVSFRQLPNWPRAARAHPSFKAAADQAFCCLGRGPASFLSQRSRSYYTSPCRLRFLSGNFPCSLRQEKSLLPSAHAAPFCSISMRDCDFLCLCLTESSPRTQNRSSSELHSLTWQIPGSCHR